MNIQKFTPTLQKDGAILEALIVIRRTGMRIARTIRVSKRSGKWVIMHSGMEAPDAVQRAEDRYLDKQHELAMQKFMSEATV